MSSESKNVPNWIVEYLVTNLYTDLKEGKYISASIQARSILELSRTSYVPQEVLQLSQRAIQILDQKGYTEQNYLLSLSQRMQDTPCPPGSILPKSDGNCEDGYIPLFGSDKKAKCCVKMQKQMEKMDRENIRILRDMQEQKVDVSVRQAFEKRFALAKDSENYKEKSHMLSTDVQEHTRKFIGVTLQKEEKRLNEVMPAAMENGDAHKLVGMDKSLFDHLVQYFGDVAKFISWYIQHDWSYWWIAIYLFRFLSLFVCMWVSLDNAKTMMDALAESYLGFKPLTLFLTASWGPLVLAPVLFSAIMTAMGNVTIFTQIFQGVSQALGSFMTLGFLHFRIMNLLSSYGFVADLGLLIRDIFYTAQKFMQASGKAYMEGKGVIGALSAGLGESVSFYCKNPLKVFFSQALVVVQQITVNLFYVICVAVGTIISGGIGLSAAKTTCGFLQRGVESLFQALKVATSLQGLLEGNVFEDTPEQAQERSSAWWDFDKYFWGTIKSASVTERGLVPYAHPDYYRQTYVKPSVLKPSTSVPSAHPDFFKQTAVDPSFFNVSTSVPSAHPDFFKQTAVDPSFFNVSAPTT